MQIALYILLLMSLPQVSEKEIEDKVLLERFGDLNKDGIEEKVVVYETNEQTELGNVRVIVIFKKKNGKWIEWQKSKNAILKSKQGGTRGDPFQDIRIEKGILKISFYGGSSWKWTYTDKYRFQNNQFELIGYTSHYFKLCEYWESVDFNLSIGKIIASKEYEACGNQDRSVYKKENEIFYKKGIRISLQNRYTKEVKIVTPKYKREIYLAQRKG